MLSKKERIACLLMITFAFFLCAIASPYPGSGALILLIALPGGSLFILVALDIFMPKSWKDKLNEWEQKSINKRNAETVENEYQLYLRLKDKFENNATT